MLVAHRLALVDFLGAGQIAQVEPGLLEHAPIVSMYGLQQYLKYSVRSAGLGIHGSLPDKPVLLAPLHQLQTVHIVRDRILGQSLDKNAVELGLVQVECLRFGEVLQQVVDLLVVDLQE